MFMLSVSRLRFQIQDSRLWIPDWKFKCWMRDKGDVGNVHIWKARNEDIRISLVSVDEQDFVEICREREEERVKEREEEFRN